VPIRNPCWGLVCAIALAAYGAHAAESSESDESPDVGRQVAEEMGRVENAELARWVQAVGERVAGPGGRGAGFRFQVVDQGEPNAFALPDGNVFVSRGLLELAQSEDELAGVLGHEIAHVTRRHAAARQEVARTAVNPMMLPGILLGTVLGSGVGKATTEPFRAFSAPYVAAYSRDQERDADRIGQKLAAAAGYDPRALGLFLKRLNRFERERFGHSRLPSFMDSHPGTSERAGQTAADAGLIEWKRVPALAASRAEFLRQIDGLVVGPRASEGMFLGERFLHPDLDFSIRFPTGWQLVNADMAVGAISPDHNVQIFLTPPVPGDSPAAAARAFVERNAQRYRLEVSDPRELQLGPLPAFRFEAIAHTLPPVAGQLTWIAHEGRIYRLTAIAPPGIGQKYLGRAQNTARSFRSLTPEERASITERRLRSVEAREGETLAELSRRSGNGLGTYLTAVANDLDERARLRAGTLVKIAREEPYTPRAAKRSR
jgi:predicted Zn-dependent protease